MPFDPMAVASILLFALVILLLGFYLWQRRIMRRLWKHEARRQAYNAAFPDLVFLVNREGRYLEVPSSTNALILMPPSGQIVGATVHDLLPPDLADRFLNVINQTLDTGEPHLLEYQLTVPAGECWFEARTAPLHVSRAAPDTVVWIARDITRRKLAELERERLIEELDAFAHTVGHALGNPLHLMMGYTSMLLDEYPRMTPEEVRTYLQTCLEAVATMNSITESLMLLAGVRKMEEIPLSLLEMQPVARSACQCLTYLIGHRAAEITLPDFLPPAVGYSPWVEEVWVNYVSNAVKYGGLPPRIEIGGQVQDDGFVRYWVQDNGPGILEEKQAQLFTPFTQLRQVRLEKDAHGLGLSIVQRIVERLGGSVGVESTLGQGSRFWFTLPGVLETASPGQPVTSQEGNGHRSSEEVPEQAS